MNVKRMIKELQKLDPNLELVIPNEDDFGCAKVLGLTEDHVFVNKDNHSEGIRKVIIIEHTDLLEPPYCLVEEKTNEN